MRTFQLNRIEDESGLSGTGIVAEGVQFENGKCVLCWLPAPSSIVIHDSIDNLIAIQCHNDKTVVEWTGEEVDQAEAITDFLEKADELIGNFLEELERE